MSESRVITLGRVVHLTSAKAEAEVRARHGVDEISDECAATIASWWQSPGPDGAAMAALASGAPVEYDALRDGISDAYRSCSTMADWRSRALMVAALDMLGTWAIAKVR